MRRIVPAAGFAGLIALAVIGPSEVGHSTAADLALVVAYAAAVLTGFMGAFRRRGERLAWLLLALGLPLYALDGYLRAVGSVTHAPPTTAAGLLLYPLALTALVLLIKRHFPRFGRVRWLDASISGLGVAAVAALLLRAALPVLNRETAGDAAYAIGDLVSVAFLMATYALGGAQPKPAFRRIGAGVVLLAIADSIYLARVGDQHTTPGTIVSLAWPAGLLAIGNGLNMPAADFRADGLRDGAPVLVIGAAAACLPIAILTPFRFPVALAAASLGLLLVITRLWVSLLDNERLVADGRAEIAQRKRAEATVLQISEERDAILEAAGDGIIRIDGDGRITYVNGAGAAMLGWPPDELHGRHAHSALHHSHADGSPHPIGECAINAALTTGATKRIADDVFWRKDGAKVPVAYVTAPLANREEQAGLVCVFRDTSARKRAEAERNQLLARLQAMARTDQLTGLANRRAWDEELKRELSRSARFGTPLAVGMLDLDRFKDYNDTYGHLAGDELLREAADLWRLELRDTDFIARYGGEEFGVLLPNCGADLAEAALGRLRAVTPAGQTFSAGVGTWDGNESADELTARADEGLYRAKQTGRDRIVVA